ncbi:MAG: DUF2007 domain-containing protein [Verrucomicrobiota bacterium]|nr:DUF2007 domain-containing protein [Verrucomicrobiota bacterium]
MSKMNVASFNEMDKAEVLRQRLEEAGIHAEVYDESKWQKFWFMSKPLADKKIRVEEKDFEKAKAVLEGLDHTEDALHDAVRCPQCGSPQVEYPQFTRKFITPILIEIFCTTKLLDKEFYCEACHYTWPKEIKLEHERDIMGWPRKEDKLTPEK